LPLAKELEEIGKTRNDAVSEWLGRFQQGVSRRLFGELLAARAMFEQCMDLAEPARRKIRGMGSGDSYIALLGYLALTLACLGYIDQARSTMNEALSEARRL